MTMADTVAVMNNGLIEQMGAPTELYESPHTAFVANFLGQSNLFPAVVVDVDGDEVILEDPDGTFRMPLSRFAPGLGRPQPRTRVIHGVRPEKISIARLTEHTRAPSHGNFVDGHIRAMSFLGVSTQYQVVTAAGETLSVFAQNRDSADILGEGVAVRLDWAPEHGFVLDGREDINAGVDELVTAEVAG